MSNTATLIKNALIVTMDKDERILTKHDLLIENGVITKVGQNLNIENKHESIDASGKIMIPGLINGHTHIAMTLLRGLADDLPLNDWLNQYIWPAEAKFTHDYVYWGSKLACWEMAASGTTCFNDMYFFVDDIANATQESGMRGLISFGSIDFPTPNTSHITNDKERWDYTLKLNEDFFAQWKNHSHIHPSYAAHAPYTVSPKHLEDIAQAAHNHKANIHIHVAETQHETQLINDTFKQSATSPTQYLAQLGFLKEKIVAAHMVWTDQKDLELIKEYNVGIAHCPKSNLKLGSGYEHNISQMRKINIPVSIATDGTASNNTLNLWNEIQFASLLPKINDPLQAQAKDIFRMATIDGAKALHMDHLIGSIEVGKRADLVLLSQDHANQVPYLDANNIYSRLVYATQSENVDTVLVNGQCLKKDGQMNNALFDQDQIKHEAVQIRKTIENL
ncbi:MAG TPA: amidohydrolase [Oligoflexia bacterium]|nr:amidohydrolase [Oligoflexia bacterium]HMR24626.1 amidohydrolase [Oligoflexia bacterium]